MNMDISLDEQHVEHLKRKVVSGAYSSLDAVVGTALALLDEHDQNLAAELAGVHRKVQQGITALRSDACAEYTDETLPELFDDVSRRGRDRRRSAQ